MGPTYSIVMTSFNYAAYVGAAIESVLAQTYQDWELLIVDDRSTDESWEIIQKYQDPRIHSYLQPVNLGACEAYNFALSKARGRYIASLDSDDIFMPFKLERQLAFFERHPDIGVCGVFVSEIDRTGAPLAGTTPHADWFNVDLDLNDPAHWVWANHLCHSGAVVRAELHRTVGPFNTNLVFTPDWEFWLRALIAGAGFAVIPEPLVVYRNHGGNITQNSGGNARTTQEHARTASELLIPWLMREGRLDLIQTLIGGVVTRIAGQPAVESAVAKALAGGAGAALATTAALRMIGDQRAAMVEAERWRLQMIAGQEEMQARLSTFAQRDVEREESRALESAAWTRLEAEARNSLASADARREEERSREAEKENKLALECASLRRLEAEARVSLAAVTAQREADKLAEAEEAERWAVERASLRRLEAEAKGALVAVAAQRDADKLREAEKDEAWAFERASWRQLEAEMQASLDAVKVEKEAARLATAEKEEKMALERATWRRLLAEARGFLTAAESTLVRLDQRSARKGLKSVWAKLSKASALMRPAAIGNSGTSFVRSTVSENGAVEVVLTDLHGVSFAPKDHKTLLVVHELSRTGAPRVVLYLAQAIRQLTGITPLIWSPVDGDIRAEFEADGFPVIVDSCLNDYHPVHAAPRLAVASFDNVIVTSLAAYQFVRHFGGLANRLTWWIHEEVAGFDYVTTQLAPDLAMLFEYCEAIWLGSPLCFAPAGQHAAHHKLFLLLYGCDDTSKPAVPDPDGRMVISIVGSVEPRKGQDIFMDAIEMLPREQQNSVLFRIIGAVPHWCADFEVSLRARAAAIPHIEFIPNVPPEQLDDLYAATDVVVSASRSDPMPIAITQCLMFGKACVCSSVIGHAPLLQHERDALIFESENASQLAEKLSWLISNPQAVALIGAHGRQVYEANFLKSQFVANVDYLLKIEKS